jgi:RNA polymerase sigma-70 factor (ECF subfamily)
MSGARAFADAELIEHLPRLRRYALALTRDGDRADDLVQDTIMRALDKHELWRPGSSLRAWLFTLLHNTYVNQIRAIKRRPETVELTETNGGSRPAAAEGLLFANDLASIISGLDISTRRLLALISDGHSYEAVAGMLDVPTGTVRSRLSRVRAMLSGAA